MSVVVTAWSGLSTSTRGKLVDKVARLYGADSDDTDVAALALDFLDDCVADLNSNVYQFNMIQETGITLTDGTQAYDLASNFFKDSLAYLNKTSDGEDGGPLTYLPWVSFKKLGPSNTNTGSPFRYSLFNVEDDGKVYLYPLPDSSIADNYTLTVEYYRRVPLISSVSAGTGISVPREIENAIVYGAQKRMAMHIVGSGHKDVVSLAALELEALERLKKIDRTHPDGQYRFRIAGAGYGSHRHGGTFIRVD